MPFTLHPSRAYTANTVLKIGPYSVLFNVNRHQYVPMNHCVDEWE